MEKVIQANCDTKTSYSILGLVVVYKPEKALLIKNISAIIADVDYLIIWKNSELGFSETEIISLCDKKIRIEGNQGNMGIWRGSGRRTVQERRSQRTCRARHRFGGKRARKARQRKL